MSTDHKALLVIDVQQGLVDQMGFGLDYVHRVRQAIETARAASIRVIYARIAFQEGAPEVSPVQRSLYNFAKSGAMTKTSAASQIHSLITPKSEDIVITRPRVSAFKGSELDLVLRTLDIKHLVLSGNATRMGILATLFDAGDNGYQLTVLSDCCIDYDQAVHHFLMKEVFPLQASVISLKEWGNQLTHPVGR